MSDLKKFLSFILVLHFRKYFHFKERFIQYSCVFGLVVCFKNGFAGLKHVRYSKYIEILWTLNKPFKKFGDSELKAVLQTFEKGMERSWKSWKIVNFLGQLLRWLIASTNTNRKLDLSPHFWPFDLQRVKHPSSG